MRAIVALVLASHCAAPAYAMGPKNPEPGDRWMYSGRIDDGAEKADVYFDNNPAKLKLADTSVISTIAIVHQSVQHAPQGAYYQKLLTIRIWCNNHTYDPKPSITYLDQNGKFQFIDPGSKTITPQAIKPHTVGEAAYNNECH